MYWLLSIAVIKTENRKPLPEGSGGFTVPEGYGSLMVEKHDCEQQAWQWEQELERSHLQNEAAEKGNGKECEAL